MSAPIIRIREDSLWSRFLVRCDHDGVISADVYGRPTPMVTWYFDLGEKVIEGERFRTEVEDGGRGHRLVIANVSEELDRRFVTIFAANIHGWDTAMMDLKAFRGEASLTIMHNSKHIVDTLIKRVEAHLSLIGI